MTYRTEQEEFWAGSFGDEYIERNHGREAVASNLALFARILDRTCNVSSVMEFGANIGLNLIALRQLLPNSELHAIEINRNAVEKLKTISELNVKHSSILEFAEEIQADFVLLKGILIHLDPELLQRAYETIYKSTARYLCIAEYYNPYPIEVEYRGHRGKLFKRDFAGEVMDMYPDMRLVDYGFTYHRDANFPQDDVTWFLLEKKSGA